MISLKMPLYSVLPVICLFLSSFTRFTFSLPFSVSSIPFVPGRRLLFDNVPITSFPPVLLSTALQHPVHFPARPYSGVILIPKGTQRLDSNTGSLWFKSPCDFHEFLASQFHNGTLAPGILIAHFLQRLFELRMSDTIDQAGHPVEIPLRFFSLAQKRFTDESESQMPLPRPAGTNPLFDYATTVRPVRAASTGHVRVHPPSPVCAQFSVGFYLSSSCGAPSRDV